MSRLLASAIVVLSVACSTSDATSEQTRKTIEQLSVEVTQAANALDADRFMNYMARDSGLVIVFDGEIAIGWDAASRGQRTYWSELFRADYKVETTRVRVISPELAIATNTGAALEVPKIGEHRRGHFVTTVVWQRRAEGWRIVQVHESTLP